MRKTKKTLAMIMAATLAIGSLAGCGGSSSSDNETTGTENASSGASNETDAEKVTLKVWAPQEDQDAKEGYEDGLLQYMCEKFNDEHPEYDITFEYGVVAEGDCLTEMQKDAEAAADVFMFASDQLGQMVASDIIYPITLNTDTITAENTEASIEAATLDNQLYAYPFTPNSWFLYYDKSKYTEEEVQSLDTMMSKDLGDGVYNFACDITNGWYTSAYFFAGGCNLFGADGTDIKSCDFNSAGGFAAGNYLADLAANSKFLEVADGNDLAALKEGTLAATCTGTWDAQTIMEALGDNYAAAKLPCITLDGKECQLSSFSSYKLIGVNTQTDAPLAAMALAEYLAGEECQQIRFEARDITPTNLAVLESDAVKESASSSALSAQSEVSTLQPSVPEMSNYWSSMGSFAEGIVSGEVNKDNMQQKLDDLTEQILTSISE